MGYAQENVYYLRKQKRFSLAEARRLLPLIQDITTRAYQEAQPMLSLLQTHLPAQEQIDLSHRVQHILDGWSEEILRLGAVPKGLWLVDFDNGQGFYCWKYGEPDLAFAHGYHEGYSTRIPIE